MERSAISLLIDFTAAWDRCDVAAADLASSRDFFASRDSEVSTSGRRPAVNDSMALTILTVVSTPAAARSAACLAESAAAPDLLDRSATSGSSSNSLDSSRCFAS